MSDRASSILCVTMYEKGQAFLRECARSGLRVILLTEQRLERGNWPYDVLAEVHAIPLELSQQQIISAVSWLGRDRHIDRIVALDEFDMETVANLREHFRLPGMGTTATNLFRDKLAMRVQAAHSGIRVPAFTGVFNYDDLRAWTASVPVPWVLKPRTQASSLGIRKLQDVDSLWRALDELGDQQSHFVLERFVPGKVFHVDGIVSERRVMLAAAHEYGHPPMSLTHEGGVFTTRLLERDSELSRRLAEMHARVVASFGLERGVTHTEYIQSQEDGELYFLEAAARVGGAYIANVIEASFGIDPWVEWARLEIAAMRGETYALPRLRQQYAGSVLCLAQQEWPDTSAYDAPEVVHRMKQRHHAGLIVSSPDPHRTKTLLEEYSRRFLNDYCAVLPPPERPTA